MGNFMSSMMYCALGVIVDVGYKIQENFCSICFNTTMAYLEGKGIQPLKHTYLSLAQQYINLAYKKFVDRILLPMMVTYTGTPSDTELNKALISLQYKQKKCVESQNKLRESKDFMDIAKDKELKLSMLYSALQNKDISQETRSEIAKELSGADTDYFEGPAAAAA